VLRIVSPLSPPSSLSHPQKIEGLISRIKHLYTLCSEKSQTLLTARDSAKALIALIEQKRIARAARSLLPTNATASASAATNALSAEEEAEDQRLIKQMEMHKNAAKNAAKDIKEMKCKRLVLGGLVGVGWCANHWIV